MTIITLYTLFFDDIRVIFFHKSADDYFYGLSAFAMLSFIIEMALSMYAVEGYLFSFFFWLDFVSTATMISDVGWLWLIIMGEDLHHGGN